MQHSGDLTRRSIGTGLYATPSGRAALREVPRFHTQPHSTDSAIAGPLMGVVSENRERVLRYEHLRK